MKITLTVNRKTHHLDVEPRTLLVDALRDTLGLTGTKFGCGVGVCGACTILQGDKAIRSCQMPIGDAAGHAFTTIEGLSHPCQAAWLEEEVAQCGYCQPGMICQAVALLRAAPHPSDAQIDAAMREHVCRCGTYPRIRKAIHRAAGEKA